MRCELIADPTIQAEVASTMELERLARLHEQGFLSDEESASRKRAPCRLSGERNFS